MSVPCRPTTLALLLLLAGCSGASAPASSATPSDPAVVAPPAPPAPPAEHLVRIDGELSAPGTGDCGGGPGFRTACPGRCVRVAVFERSGAFFAGRVEGSGGPSAADACSVAAVEAAATPIPAERVAQMERVIAGVDLMPTVSPYPMCPHLKIETSTRHVEAGGCFDHEGYRAADSAEPSTNRFEATARLLALLPQPPAVAPELAGLGGPRSGL